LSYNFKESSVGAASHYCAITRERLLCRLNLTDPRVLTFFNVLRALNTTGTASGQQVVSYKQLNSEAAILLTSVSGVPSVSGLVNYFRWRKDGFNLLIEKLVWIAAQCKL
jgi:hypothetical protein